MRKSDKENIGRAGQTLMCGTMLQWQNSFSRVPAAFARDWSPLRASEGLMERCVLFLHCHHTNAHLSTPNVTIQ
jgi:hypothetical protein